MLFLVGTVSSEPESYSEQLVMITKKRDRFLSITREYVVDTMGGVSLLMKFRMLSGRTLHTKCFS